MLAEYINDTWSETSISCFRPAEEEKVEEPTLKKEFLISLEERIFAHQLESYPEGLEKEVLRGLEPDQHRLDFSVVFNTVYSNRNYSRHEYRLAYAKPIAAPRTEYVVSSVLNISQYPDYRILETSPNYTIRSRYRSSLRVSDLRVNQKVERITFRDVSYHRSERLDSSVLKLDSLVESELPILNQIPNEIRSKPSLPKESNAGLPPVKHIEFLLDYLLATDVEIFYSHDLNPYEHPNDRYLEYNFDSGIKTVHQPDLKPRVSLHELMPRERYIQKPEIPVSINIDKFDLEISPIILSLAEETIPESVKSISNHNYRKSSLIDLISETKYTEEIVETECIDRIASVAEYKLELDVIKANIIRSRPSHILVIDTRKEYGLLETSVDLPSLIPELELIVDEHYLDMVLPDDRPYPPDIVFQGSVDTDLNNEITKLEVEESGFIYVDNEIGIQRFLSDDLPNDGILIHPFLSKPSQIRELVSQIELPLELNELVIDVENEHLDTDSEPKETIDLGLSKRMDIVDTPLEKISNPLTVELDSVSPVLIFNEEEPLSDHIFYIQEYPVSDTLLDLDRPDPYVDASPVSEFDTVSVDSDEAIFHLDFPLDKFEDLQDELGKIHPDGTLEQPVSNLIDIPRENDSCPVPLENLAPCLVDIILESEPVDTIENTISPCIEIILENPEDPLVDLELVNSDPCLIDVQLENSDDPCLVDILLESNPIGDESLDLCLVDACLVDIDLEGKNGSYRIGYRGFEAKGGPRLVRIYDSEVVTHLTDSVLSGLDEMSENAGIVPVFKKEKEGVVLKRYRGIERTVLKQLRAKGIKYAVIDSIDIRVVLKDNKTGKLRQITESIDKVKCNFKESIQTYIDVKYSDDKEKYLEYWCDRRLKRKIDNVSFSYIKDIFEPLVNNLGEIIEGGSLVIERTAAASDAIDNSYIMIDAVDQEEMITVKSNTVIGYMHKAILSEGLTPVYEIHETLAHGVKNSRALMLKDIEDKDGNSIIDLYAMHDIESEKEDLGLYSIVRDRYKQISEVYDEPILPGKDYSIVVGQQGILDFRKSIVNIRKAA